MERIKKFFKGKEEEEEEKEAAEEIAEVTEEPVAEVEETPEIEPVETAVEPEPTPTPTPEVEEAAPEAEVSVAVGGTIPYHATFQDRLKYMFADAQIGAGIEAPDSFMLEFMAEGERFYITKPSMGEFDIITGKAPDEDAFIRISDGVMKELLSAATFSDFSDTYMKYYKNGEAGLFVKIELRKDITALNRRGYARVPVLRTLIGSVR
jgi:hypothetical protein